MQQSQKRSTLAGVSQFNCRLSASSSVASRPGRFSAAAFASFVTVFAYIAARATEKLKENPSHKPSTLCAKSSHWAEAQKQG